MANRKRRKVEIYTDGSGDTSCGMGASALAVYIDDELHYQWKACLTPATNNVAEMVAVMKAYQIKDTLKHEDVTIRSDSKYVIETVGGNYKIKKNKELWAKMLQMTQEQPETNLVHVKGHDVSVQNNFVDKLAKNHLRQERGKL